MNKIKTENGMITGDFITRVGEWEIGAKGGRLPPKEGYLTGLHILANLQLPLAQPIHPHGFVTWSPFK